MIPRMLSSRLVSFAVTRNLGPLSGCGVLPVTIMRSISLSTVTAAPKDVVSPTKPTVTKRQTPAPPTPAPAEEEDDLEKLKNRFLAELRSEFSGDALGAGKEMKQQLAAYIKATDSKISEPDEWGIRELTREIDGYKVSVKWSIVPDIEVSEEEEEEKNELMQKLYEKNEELKMAKNVAEVRRLQAQVKELTDELQDSYGENASLPHNFRVEIIPPGKDKAMVLNCFANRNTGHLSIDNISYDKVPGSPIASPEKMAEFREQDRCVLAAEMVDAVNSVRVRELSQESQEAMYNFFERLMIDNDLSKFVQMYADEEREQQHLNAIKGFSDFIR